MEGFEPFLTIDDFNLYRIFFNVRFVELDLRVSLDSKLAIRVMVEKPHTLLAEMR